MRTGKGRASLAEAFGAHGRDHRHIREEDKASAKRGLSLAERTNRELKELRGAHMDIPAFASAVIVAACTDILVQRGVETETDGIR